MGIQFKYRLKILLKDKALIFWTLIFPMLLALFFKVALTNAYSETKIKGVPLAIVVNDENASLFLDSLESGRGLIRQTHYDVFDDAQTALLKGEVVGIVTFDGSFALTFARSAYTSDVTVISNVFETFNRKQKLIISQLEENPEAVDYTFTSELLDDTNYVSTIVTNMKSADLVSIHFFTTIAMLCLYCADWGNKSGQYLQADMSAIGIRNNVAPTNKMKLLLTDIAVVYTIFCVEFAIHILYLIGILNVSLGNNPLLLIATGLVGGLVSTTLGYAVCVSIRGTEANRSLVITMVGLLLSFFSGMMSVSVKAVLHSISPLFSKINPAALITDNFYWLYRGVNINEVYLNLGIMGVMAILLGYIAFRKMKVVTYDHL